MTAKGLVVTIGLVWCWVVAPNAYAQTSGPAPLPDITALALKVVPGKTTEAEVEALLGQPWRTINYNEPPDEPANLIWEYRGQDGNGTYRVHIEFDTRGLTILIFQIPDHSPNGKPVRERTLRHPYPDQSESDRDAP